MLLDFGPRRADERLGRYRHRLGRQLIFLFNAIKLARFFKKCLFGFFKRRDQILNDFRRHLPLRKHITLKRVLRLVPIHTDAVLAPSRLGHRQTHE